MVCTVRLKPLELSSLSSSVKATGTTTPSTIFHTDRVRVLRRARPKPGMPNKVRKF